MYDKFHMADPLDGNRPVSADNPPTGNKLQVQFTTDGSITGNGFHITYDDGT